MKRSIAIMALFLSTYCFAQSPDPDVLQSICNSNDPEACISLGTLYRDGKSVLQSFENARTYFEKACKLNDQTGCALLGELYKNGQGVNQSFKQANDYFKALLTKLVD